MPRTRGGHLDTMPPVVKQLMIGMVDGSIYLRILIDAFLAIHTYSFIFRQRLVLTPTVQLLAFSVSFYCLVKSSFQVLYGNLYKKQQ